MTTPVRALRAVRDTEPTGWEPPAPLSAVQCLPPFPVDALPLWMAEQVAAVAEATQTPPDLAGCIGLAALSAAAGGRALVRVRQGWNEPVNLYTVVGMEPSARKSPVFTAMIRPIYALERQLRENATEAIEHAKVQRRAADALLATAEKSAHTVKDGGERDAALAEAVNAAIEAARIEVPVEPKLVVDDITPEAVGSVLAEQGGRLAVLSDEGGIFAIIAGRYSGHANTNVFLKGYSGTQLRVDRNGRPSELVESPALTLGLTVQPAVIDELGDTAMLRGSGFLARILYSLPESLAGRRRSRPDPVPESVSELYNARLHTIAHTLFDWTDPAELVFSRATDDLMKDLQDELETRLDPHRGAWAHIGDWGGKFHGQTARIAGLLHIAEHPHNPWDHQVAPETFTQAWRIGDYYAAHALATFDHIGADTALEGARRVLAWIERTQPVQFTKRDAFNATRGQLFRQARDLDGPLSLLEDHGHIAYQPPPERTPGARGRKPSPTYWTHPSYRPEAR